MTAAHTAAGTAAEAEQLRARARALRRTAQLLDGCDASRLLDRAGEDTWIGPTPERCRDDLASHRRTLRAAQEELIAAARALDLQADLVAVTGSTSGGGARVSVH